MSVTLDKAGEMLTTVLDVEFGY